jgi:hypothetical protein
MEHGDTGINIVYSLHQWSSVASIESLHAGMCSPVDCFDWGQGMRHSGTPQAARHPRLRLTSSQAVVTTLSVADETVRRACSVFATCRQSGRRSSLDSKLLHGSAWTVRWR